MLSCLYHHHFHRLYSTSSIASASPPIHRLYSSASSIASTPPPIHRLYSSASSITSIPPPHPSPSPLTSHTTLPPTRHQHLPVISLSSSQPNETQKQANKNVFINLVQLSFQLGLTSNHLRQTVLVRSHAIAKSQSRLVAKEWRWCQRSKSVAELHLDIQPLAHLS